MSDQAWYDAIRNEREAMSRMSYDLGLAFAKLFKEKDNEPAPRGFEDLDDDNHLCSCNTRNLGPRGVHEWGCPYFI
jgi:hypothetical protein